MLQKITIITVFLLGFVPLTMAQGCKPTKGCEVTTKEKSFCCSAATVSKEAVIPEMPTRVTALKDDLAPFVTAFNRNTSKPRFVAILSPTCKDCVTGAQAIQRHIIEANPELDMDILLVWSPVVNSDAGDSLLGGINAMIDPRIQHFWDRDLLLGKELKKHLPLGKRDFAWDIYLFYDKAAKWTDTPPEVSSWAHQLDALGKDDAAPQFLACGEEALAKSFQASLKKLTL